MSSIRSAVPTRSIRRPCAAWPRVSCAWPTTIASICLTSDPVRLTGLEVGIERDLDVLRSINRDRDGCLAVGAIVEQSGTVGLGDKVHTGS